MKKSYLVKVERCLNNETIFIWNKHYYKNKQAKMGKGEKGTIHKSEPVH